MPIRATLRNLPAVLAAALYVLLGVSAAWHAPHFSRGVESVQQDAHAGHEAVKDGECALCPWKTAAQEFAPGAGTAPVPAEAAPAQRPRTQGSAEGHSSSSLARGPPVFS